MLSRGININFLPFTVIFVPWLIIFYIAGLYDLHRLRNNIEFLKTLCVCLVIDALIAILLFLFYPGVRHSPENESFYLFRYIRHRGNLLAERI